MEEITFLNSYPNKNKKSLGDIAKQETPTVLIHSQRTEGRTWIHK